MSPMFERIRSRAVAIGKPHVWRFATFVATGLLNTGFGYAVYLAGLWLNLLPLVALGIATFMGAVFNHFTTGRFVFRSRGAESLRRFLLVYTAIFIFNAALLHGTLALGVASWLAQGLVLPFVAVGAYAIMNVWVFRKGRADGQP